MTFSWLAESCGQHEGSRVANVKRGRQLEIVLLMLDFHQADLALKLMIKNGAHSCGDRDLFYPVNCIN